MTETLTPPIKPSKQEILSPHYAARVFGASFEFSQNGEEGQRNILRALHTLNPGWKIDDDTYKFLDYDGRERMMTYLKPGDFNEAAERKATHKGVTMEQFTQQYNQFLEFMKGEFNNPEFMPIDSTIHSLAKDMIKKDYEYLVEGAGRPRVGTDPNTPRGDRWLSYTVHYALQGNSSHIPEIDEVVGLVGTHLRAPGSLKDNPLEDEKVEAVIKKHNEKHVPEKTFKWTDPTPQIAT